jgi:hypothetical protein
MSRRSHLSLLGELKRGFIDIGRYRYMFNKFDMETWRDKTCPICNKGFTSEVTFTYESFPMHFDCYISDEGREWVQKHYDEYHKDEYPLDDTVYMPVENLD